MDTLKDKERATRSNLNYHASGQKLPIGSTYRSNEPPALALDETGVIQKCSESCEKLFGYRSGDLVKQHISRLFPQLAEFKLFLDGTFNPKLDFLCHCGHLFQAQNWQGNTFKSELSFVRIENNGSRNLRLIIRPMRNALFTGILSHDHAV